MAPNIENLIHHYLQIPSSEIFVGDTEDTFDTQQDEQFRIRNASRRRAISINPMHKGHLEQAVKAKLSQSRIFFVLNRASNCFFRHRPRESRFL